MMAPPNKDDDIHEAGAGMTVWEGYVHPSGEDNLPRNASELWPGVS